MVVRKRTRSKSIAMENEIFHEERPLEALQSFDLQPSHCKITDEDVSSLLQNLWKRNQGSVLSNQLKEKKIHVIQHMIHLKLQAR